MPKHINLDEVSFIRPILIVLLVLYHAFCPWTGAWEPFDGFEPIVTYQWIADTAYSFMLPMFVFISGYVWAFQRETLNKKDSLLKLIKKKAKRLIVPSVIFSFLYVVLFRNFKSCLSIGGGISLIYNLLCGVGHMWFLPMLFWCFVLSWALLQVKSNTVKYCLLVLLVIISILPIPLRLGNAFYYLLFFQMGYDTLVHKNLVSKRSSTSCLILLWTAFAVTFILGILAKNNLQEYADGCSSMIMKAVTIESRSFLTIVYSVIGTAVMYLTALRFTSSHSLPKWVIRLGNLCFGVYLFQQFILQFLYYYTTLPQMLGFSLPWVGFIITLFVSLLLSFAMKSSRIGSRII